MKIGYARVSTDEQTLDLQLDALRASGCETVFSDAGVSGSTAPGDRRGFAELLEALSGDDCLVVWKLDRVGRSLSDLIALLNDLEKRGVNFRSLTDGIDTTTAGGMLVFHIMGALAEFERSLIAERTKEGMSAAKKRGKHVGRPKALSDEQILHAKSSISAGETINGLASVLRVDRGTLRRALVNANKLP